MSLEPKDYLIALCRRWAWIAAAGVVGLAVGVLCSVFFPTRYTSTVGLDVGIAKVATDADVTAASQIESRVLPSFLQLARSGAVLQPVIDQLHLRETPQELAPDVKVTAAQDT